MCGGLCRCRAGPAAQFFCPLCVGSDSAYASEEAFVTHLDTHTAGADVHIEWYGVCVCVVCVLCVCVCVCVCVCACA